MIDLVSLERNRTRGKLAQHLNIPHKKSLEAVVDLVADIDFPGYLMAVLVRGLIY